jgi:ATP-dependent RNA helicase RhlE
LNQISKQTGEFPGNAPHLENGIDPELQASQAEAGSGANVDFASLGLIDPVLSAVREEGYTTPTPIQAEAIPALLTGRDLLGIAQTGTGKTAAFALPIIQRLLAAPKKHAPKTTRVLVVAPTRELAAQIDQSFAAYGRGAHLNRACIFGGVGSVPQEKALARGVDVLTATPGRLLDLIDRGHLTLSAVETVVLDEADRMFDMGFIRDVKKIVALLPRVRQTVLFSATMPPEIEAFADPIMRDPVRAAVPSSQPTADRVDQKVLFVSNDDKRKLLAAILKEDGFYRVIVFTKTKHGANRLVKQLAADGIPADAIHANKSQNQRTRTMGAFRSGDVSVLVATDLAARGIDVDDVELVVNFDLPNEPETYVHRIGRTARAGNEGVAVSFCDAEERPLLRDIERLVGFRIPVELDHPFRLEIEPLRDAPKQAARPQRPKTAAPRAPRSERQPNPMQGGPRVRPAVAPGARPQHGRYRGEGRGAAAGGRDGFRSPDFGGEPSLASLFAGAAARGPRDGRPKGGQHRQHGEGAGHQQRFAESKPRQPGSPDSGRGPRPRRRFRGPKPAGDNT